MKDNLLYSRGLKKVKDCGYKLTGARQAVLQVLCENHIHLTSAEISQHVKEVNPKIGRASIFRTLELFTELSIIRPTYYEAQSPHYIVLDEDGHHAHFICNQCERVVELEECQINDMLAEFTSTHGFKMTGHVLEIYGICDNCGSKADSIDYEAEDSAALSN
ncbi:MAG: transcriptional repressor [Anaerolineaceae bacterium]|nr:transcriptional repressor [Anaerolineaceae bacterium]